MEIKAKDFAEKAHENQVRKIGKTPYIEHPIRVAARLKENNASTKLICAGYLHDVVEDTPITLEEIKIVFGEEIASLVALHTEDKTKSWQERKQHTIDTLKKATLEEKQLIVADRLDNLLSTKQSLKEHGEAVWDYFNADKKQQQWYNESIVHHMYDGIDKTSAPEYFKDLEKTVEHVFK